MKYLFYSVLLVYALGMLSACSAASQSAAESGASQVEPTAVPTDSPASPTPTPSCEAVTIFYEENAQFELSSSQGQRVLFDIARPRSLSAPPTESDVLVTTHRQHSDHFVASFSDSFPGQQLSATVGKIELPDVTIEGIASSHTASGELLPEKGSNYIFIVDVDGMRIAHFGDIGQDALTPEQLDALGQVDIAFMQIGNSFSQMDSKNLKAFNLMDQVKPHLIIVTHSDGDTAKYAAEKWQGLYTDQPSIKLCKSDIPAETHILFMGQLATAYQALFNLPTASW